MKQITVNPPAKVNWMLHITGRRPNGYHELDMLMQTISLRDELTLTPWSQNELFVNGVRESEPENNLVARAIRAISAYTGKDIRVKAELTKHIPSRAGLGGGSSDCAYTMLALNELYGFGLTKEELCSMGVRLGADVPYFFYGGLCRVSGIGEILSPCENVPKTWLVLKHVGEGLSTPEVYRAYDEADPVFASPCADRIALYLQDNRFAEAFAHSTNDLEAPAVCLLPEIGTCLQMIRSLGARTARMTGSGSAVYGVFETEEAATQASRNLPGSLVVHTM